MTSDLMTVREVATYLQLHPMTVYKLVRERSVPMKKIGGQWRIRETTLLQWLEEETTVNAH